MYERKQQVIQKAHQLFIEKGFQATSIQDILDYSGISKGTFYNYFPSKSELIKAVFLSIQNKYERERNELLIGENLDDIEVFVKQLDLMMQSNKKNKLFRLVEEVFVSNDSELKQFIKRFQLMHISWMYNRFLDLFGEEKKPYLLDCTIVFSGMLQQMLHYNFMDKGSKTQEIEIIRYCVDRLKKIVDDVSCSHVQLLKPNLLNIWLSNSSNNNDDFFNELLNSSTALKKTIAAVIENENKRKKYLQLLDFIQEELINNKKPRLFLIESSLLSLNTCPHLQHTKELDNFQQLLSKYVLKDCN
ncbi:TetR/AcrR family transcriptional regulator [Heyndrickxia sp. NPDC080065]|uniref:TetR/AcrR family transcriptional regulator n=1 Tax=Heyndrickxia sp. NPDC080065 TaxID=3390568 RepID=UPI003D014A5B